MDHLLLFMFHVRHDFLPVIVTYWERANLLALLCVRFSCVFVTFPCSVLGLMWFLIVSIPDLCPLSYFDLMHLFGRTHENLEIVIIL